MNAWDSLPNGKHIDAVLEFFRTHPYSAWAATRDAAWDAARAAARAATWDATAALVAWDSAGDLFAADLSVVELAAHGGDHAAILLLPLKRVMEHAAKATGEAE